MKERKKEREKRGKREKERRVAVKGVVKCDSLDRVEECRLPVAVCHTWLVQA